MAAAKTAARDTTAELAFLTRASKAPTLRESVARLAERARAESWTHEEFLAACLQREVAARESHGGEGRIRAAKFPARKSLEEFDFDHARGLKREVIAHLGTLDFAAAKDNVVFLGPPGTGKTHLAIGLAIRACQAGHRVAFATAAEWVARLAEAHHAGRLQAELIRLGRYPLLVIDEVGYIPFEPEAANLFFQLVSARYERASLIVTSNRPFGRWGETFGDDVVAAAMIDRLVHHAEVIALKGDSRRLGVRVRASLTSACENDGPDRTHLSHSGISAKQAIDRPVPPSAIPPSRSTSDPFPGEACFLQGSLLSDVVYLGPRPDAMHCGMGEQVASEQALCLCAVTPASGLGQQYYADFPAV